MDKIDPQAVANRDRAEVHARDKTLGIARPGKMLLEKIHTSPHLTGLGSLLFQPCLQLNDLAFGLHNIGYSKEEADSMINTYLIRLGMSDLSERPPHNLSGGEKRMISIAGVIIMNPTVVMLDEPESSLDSRARRQLIEFLNNSEETLLIASHDLEFLLETCDRTAILDNGRICADGLTRELMGDEPLMNSHGFEELHSLIPHVEPHHRG